MNKLSTLLRGIPASVRYLFTVALVATFIFAWMRLLFLYINHDGSFTMNGPLFRDGFLVGWHFDMVVVSYVIALPILLISLHYVFRLRQKHLLHLATWIVALGLAIAAFACIADIPYFQFFKNRLTVDALQWMNTPGTVFAMIIGNPMHLMFLLIGLMAAVGVTWLFHKLASKILLQSNWPAEFRKTGRGASVVTFLVCGLICFLGMRGKMTHPIRAGDAFYCTTPVLNQGALNPVFTFMKSLSNKVRLMGDEEALAQATGHLGIEMLSATPNTSPFYRLITNNQPLASKPNVVLVLMEGMASRFMGRFGNTKGLTPSLDSLAGISLFFENAFSAGIHTNNGVFSTLYGFPALKRVRPMSDVPVRKFTGLPYALKQRGYRNYFFCSHNREFDNLGNFIPSNHFDALFTQENFPASESIGPYGVPDGFLFDKLINHLDTATRSTPVFATVLTASNHDPYVIPGDFESNLDSKELRAVQYADHAIGVFLANAATKPWFENTVFVFVADHGRVHGAEPYDLQFSFSHIPIIVHAPAFVSPSQNKTFICQVDVFPTIMGILGGGYLNNAAGLDVIRRPRPAAYFSQDDKIGCVNDRWLYVYRFGGKESLYDYKTGSVDDFSDMEPKAFTFLRNYALSQTQASERVIASDLTGP